MDDYVGDPHFEPVMDYVDIIKVDFMRATHDGIADIANRFKGTDKVLLAEKVETEEEFARAVSLGVTLFQGYYFSKPKTIKGRSIKLDAGTYATIITELGKLEPNYISLTEAIRINANLTYKLLQYVNTLKFAAKTPITGIQMALVNMGLNEVRRWILLMMARGSLAPTNKMSL